MEGRPLKNRLLHRFRIANGTESLRILQRDKTNIRSIVAADKKLCYWQLATEKLRETKPEVYEKLLKAIRDVSNPSQTLEERIRVILSADIKRITDRQWRIKWGARNFEVKKIIDGIVKALQKFKDIGSAAAVLDPVHAGLPWASICVLLPLILNLSSQEDAAKTGLDIIAAVVVRYATIEQSYRQSDDFEWPELFEKSLVELYAKVLEYEAVAAGFLGKPSFPRIGRAIIKLDDFDGIIGEVRKMDANCLQFHQVLDQKFKNEKLDRIFNTAIETLKKLDESINKNKSIISWLSNLKYGQDHENARTKLGSTYSDSGQWLLQSNEYAQWSMSRPNNVLWLRGHVGTGKTSLVSIVIDQFLRNLKSTGEERLAYFYCSRKEKVPVSSLEVLRCLASQLSWANDGILVAEPVKMLHEEADELSGAGLPNAEKCQDLLVSLTSSCPQNTIIVDALDECSDPELLLETLQAFLRSRGDNARAFVSSRMHVDVLEFFPECKIVGPEENREDVAFFIQTEVTRRKRRLLNGKRQDLEKRLITILTERAENVFRWAELQLDIFLSRKSRMIHEKDVERRLDELESQIGKGLPSLNQAYDEIYEMNTPQPHIRALAERVIKWLLLPLLPLYDANAHTDATAMSEINATIDAISIDVDGCKDPTINLAYVLDICSNLILVNHSSSSFQFAHLSVVEYLMTKTVQRDSAQIQEYSYVEVSTQVTISCLSYLLYLVRREEFRSLARRPILSRKFSQSPAWGEAVPTLQYSLLQFAVTSWPTFYHMSHENQTSRVLQQLFHHVMKSASRSSVLQYWVDTYKDLQEKGLTAYRERTRNASLLSPSISREQRTPPARSMLVDPEELFVDGVASRAFVAAAFGFEHVLMSLLDSEIERHNDRNHTCSQVARDNLW